MHAAAVVVFAGSVFAVVGIDPVTPPCAPSALHHHARSRVVPTTGPPLAHMQWVQFETADAWVNLRGARLLADHGAWLADHDPDEPHAGGLRSQVADLALRAAGASGYLKSTPIERHFRDAQTGALMAYATEVCRDVVGKPSSASG